ERFTATANPPSEVSLYLLFISCAVCHIVFTTLSNGTFTFLGSVSKANSAALMALMAPMVLRSIHGICTKPAIGSQVKIGRASCRERVKNELTGVEMRHKMKTKM